MIAREGDHEQTTQENVWAIIAPGNWMELTRELQEDYDYAVDLNGEQLLARVVTPRNVRDQQTLHIPIDELTAQCVLLLRGQVTPSQAYTFYSPEVFGRTDGTLFTIKEAQILP